MHQSHGAAGLGRAGRREQQPAARKIDYMLYWIEKFYEMTKNINKNKTKKNTLNHELADASTVAFWWIPKPFSRSIHRSLPPQAAPAPTPPAPLSGGSARDSGVPTESGCPRVGVLMNWGAHGTGVPTNRGAHGTRVPGQQPWLRGQARPPVPREMQALKFERNFSLIPKQQ